MMSHAWPYWAFLIGQSVACGAVTGYLCRRHLIAKSDLREAELRTELTTLRKESVCREAQLQAELSKERERLIMVAERHGLAQAWEQERRRMRPNG